MAFRMNALKLVWVGLLLLGLPITVHAQFTGATNNGAFVITGYQGPGGAVTIPGHIGGLPVIIHDHALAYQNTFTNLTMMNGVIGIGSNSFFGCANLANVVIPGTVTNIGGYAFNYCLNLTNVVISNGVANIAEGAFRLDSMKNIVIPGSVTNIGPHAFDGCYHLTNVTISTGVECVGSNAFFGCTELPNVSIPSSVLSIGEAAFEDCSSLSNITVDSLNPNYASVTGVLFNKSLTTLVEFPGGAYRMLSYTIPAGVTCIGDSAFEECVQTSVTIPNGVNSIGNHAFFGCFQLPSINIPSSVTNIGIGALSSCLKMTNITVDPANPNYASAEGVLFDKMFGTLIQFPMANTGSYVIPNSVVNIESAAFESSGLTAATIPNSVTNIGIWAFRYSSLNNVTVPGSVGSIGDSVFWNCNDLTNVTLLNGVTNIGIWAFGACNGLTSVTIPASVQTIADFAFYLCPDLTNVYCYGDAPTVLSTQLSGSSEAFYGDPGTIYYLPGTLGWTNTLGGLPTAPWHPMILNSSVGQAGPTNQFGFTISWAINTSVVVEACTNLFQPVWQPVQTNTLTDGSINFSDPQSTNYPTRYYRLRAQ
jgi:Leucine Rich Repeat (LRR) protein